MPRKKSRRGRYPNRVAALSVTPAKNVEAGNATEDPVVVVVEPDAPTETPPVFDLAALEELAAADEAADDSMPSCSNCAHPFAMHSGDGGACGMDECGCKAYAEDDMGEASSLAAAATVAWDGEAGFQDLIEDLEDAINGPSETYRWYVLDVKLDLSAAIVCDGDDYYLVPFTLGDSNEPVIAPSADWVEVERAGWMATPEGEAALAGLRRGALIRAFQHGMPCGCGHTLSEHVGAGGPCSHEDGRGTCSCKTFSEASADAALRHMRVVRGEDVAQAFGFTMTNSAAGNITTVALSPNTAEVALPPEHTPGETLPDPSDATTEPVPTFEWVATLCPEATLTSDGRAFAPGSITWPRLESNGSLTLMGMVETSEGGHLGAQIAGRIDSVWRDQSLIRGSGVFDGGEWGQNIARLVGDRTLLGISVDLAIQSYEFGPRSDYFDADGNWAPKDAGRVLSTPELMAQVTDDGEEIILVVTAAELGMATVCPFPAFAGATIEKANSLVAGANEALYTVTMQSGMTVTRTAHGPEPLVASAVDELTVTAPPAEWFTAPQLDGPTALTITEDGRIFGHAALWHTCHIGIAGVCTEAPTSESGYAYFHLGEVLCEDGERVACGTVTLDAPHADRRLGRADATRHYDHTGTAAARVVCGEDEHGIWVAGAVNTRLPQEAVEVLRASKLSGDWRNVNGRLELVALLAVNVPGFPVPRALVASVDGHAEVLTLLAAGLGAPADVTPEQRDEFAAIRRAVNGDAAHLDAIQQLAAQAFGAKG